MFFKRHGGSGKAHRNQRTSELRPTARMRTIRYGALAQAPVDAQFVVCGLAAVAFDRRDGGPRDVDPNVHGAHISA